MTTNNPTPGVWAADHRNLAALADWMHQNDYDTSEIVRMLEKPWNYEAQWNLCQTGQMEDEIEEDEGPDLNEGTEFAEIHPLVKRP